MTTPEIPSPPCSECGFALAADQRYCLQCGARNGPARVDHLRELGVHEPPRAEPAALSARRLRPVAGRRTAVAAGVAAVAAVAAGVVLGWLSGPAPVASSAGTPARVVLLEPAARVMAAAPTVTPTAAPAQSDTPAPTPEPTDTPEPEPTDTATATATETPSHDTPLTATTPTPTATPAPPPAITHVWLIHVADLATGYPAELAPKGTLLSAFTPVDPSPLAEGVALLSGQPPTAQTRAGCPAPTEIAKVDAATGLASGDGCRYPAAVLTLAGQLATAGLSWKAYVPDPTQGCPAPLNAFHSLEVACTPAPLDALATDPAPALAWIAPADDAGLRAVLPSILAAPAYADGGLVVLTADGPGALLLSPLVRAGATVDAAAGPYALLRTLEDAFGLVHLGHAADADVGALGADVFPISTPTATS
jgi:hypothetical protein